MDCPACARSCDSQGGGEAIIRTGCFGTSPGVCSSCALGHYTDDGVTCHACPPGHTCIAGCKRAVPPGMQFVSAVTPPEVCGSAAVWCLDGNRSLVSGGHYSTCSDMDDAACLAQPLKRSAQQLCTVGFACANGVRTPCGVGHYQNATGQDDCAEVSVGHYTEGGAEAAGTEAADQLRVAQYVCDKARARV